MNWYIGQEVEYIGRTVFEFEKGETGHITKLEALSCGCGVVIGINDKKSTGDTYCLHDVLACPTGGPIAIPERNFRPLMDITELKEILNEETVTK